jgi:alpha-L-fucosidase
VWSVFECRPDKIWPNLQRFTATRAKRATAAVINYKDNAFEQRSATLDVERGQLPDIGPMHWQTDTSISNASWGYIENKTFKSPEFMVHLVAAIYGTRPCIRYGEGPTVVECDAFHEKDTKPYTSEDFRFTPKGENLY